MTNTNKKHTIKEINAYNDLREELNGKLQIRIPIWIHDILSNDLENYTITTGTANYTAIITKILSSMKEYRKFERDTKLKILKAADAYVSNYYGYDIDVDDDEDRLVDLADDASLYIDTIMTILEDDENKNRNLGTVRIDIHITYENTPLLSYVQRQCGTNLSIGEYILQILRWYCSKPAYKREQILFSKTLNDIKRMLKDKDNHFYDVYMKSNGGHIVTMKPYKLVHGKDDVHNYLIGVRHSNNIDKPTSLRLDNMDNSLDENFIVSDQVKSREFEENEIKTFERMISNNPAYPFFSFSDEHYVLRFNPIVEKKYKAIYTQRPRYIDRKENKDGTVDYTFDCSSRQINQYLIRLISSFNRYELDAATIEIINPIPFKDKFKDYYLQFIKILKD